MLKNVIKHTIIILKHKWWVFKLCCKIGLPWRGFIHDFSKFSPTEFGESMKYCTGTHSPILEARKEKGYSACWLHHKGRNKHHVQYWLDFDSKNVAQVLPYKYAAEAICDNIAAGIVYNGKKWKQSTQYEYWMMNKDKLIINPKMENFFEAAFMQVKEEGIDKTLTKKNMKRIYKKCCIDDKTEYICEVKTNWKKIKKEEVV